MDWFLVVQAGVTLFMTGLIWFVQVVHYPLMARVGSEAFRSYHRAHTRRTSWVVGPPMLVEGVTAWITAIRPPAGLAPGQTWLGLALLLAIWASTALLQVPQHSRLSRRFEADAQRRLVVTNWVRVACWSARSVLLLSWLS